MLLTALLFTLGAPAAAADELGECPVVEPEVCAIAGDMLSDTEWLRAIALDVRGDVPTVEEYLAVESGDRTPEDYLDAWLDEPAFRERVVRLHRELLHNELGFLERGLTNPLSDLRKNPGKDYYFRYQDPYRRTADDPLGRPCADRPATPEDPDGWVWVTDPYWAPGTSVKVCAPEANEATVSPTGLDCGSFPGSKDAYCGCGPQLRYCEPIDWHDRVVHGFNREVEVRLQKILESGGSYLDLLQGRTMWVNGPMVHYLRYQRWQAQSTNMELFPVDPDILPDIPAHEENTWRPVSLGSEHAGVLTSTAYLSRFTSQRARAKQFREAFRCEPFIPDVGGIALGTSSSMDLARRSGCSSCHYWLEPAAAAWGRWMPFGAGYLDPDEYPTFNEDCFRCAAGKPFACSSVCRNAYLVDSVSAEQNPYIGMLSAMQFLSAADQALVGLGPKELVRRSVADGTLQACVANTAAEQFLGRSLMIDEPYDPRDPMLHLDLTDALVSSGWDYRTLVRAILTSDAYRRAW